MQRHSLLLAVVVIVLSITAAIGLRQWLHPPLHLQSVKLFEAPYRRLSGYSITIAPTMRWPLDLLVSHWTLVYFADSQCANACQADLASLQGLLEKSLTQDEMYQPKILVLCLDSHDSETAVNQYLQPLNQAAPHQGSRLIGAASIRQDEITMLFNFFHDPAQQQGIDLHQLAELHHSSQIAILDPQLRLIGYFNPPYNADILASDLEQLKAQAWRYHLQR